MSSLVFNVLLGIVFIAAGLIIFSVISSAMGSAGKQDVYDAQTIDIWSSYAGYFLKINSSNLDEVIESFQYVSENDEDSIFNADSLRVFKTFEEELGASVAVPEEVVASSSSSSYIGVWPAMTGNSVSSFTTRALLRFSSSGFYYYDFGRRFVSTSTLLTSDLSDDCSNSVSVYCKFKEALS